METEGGSPRPGREKTVLLHPSSDEFLLAKQLDPASLAEYHDFSDQAKEAFRQSCIAHATKLIQAATNIKEGVGGDGVSEANVIEASHSLNRRQEQGGFKKLAGVVGGIFLGAAISILDSVLEANEFDRNRILLMFSAGILGAFLIAVDLPSFRSSKRRRRQSPPSQPVRVTRRQVGQARASKF